MTVGRYRVGNLPDDVVGNATVWRDGEVWLRGITVEDAETIVSALDHTAGRGFPRRVRELVGGTDENITDDYVIAELERLKRSCGHLAAIIRGVHLVTDPARRSPEQYPYVAGAVDVMRHLPLDLGEGSR